MSMIGLATMPGTAVRPKCAMQPSKAGRPVAKLASWRMGGGELPGRIGASRHR